MDFCAVKKGGIKQKRMRKSRQSRAIAEMLSAGVRLMAVRQEKNRKAH